MFLYLINETDTDHYKIGISTNHPNRRKNNLQTGNSTKLMVYKFWSITGPEVEKRLHQWFKPMHLNGEWFKLTNDDIHRIDTYLTNLEQPKKVSIDYNYGKMYMSKLLSKKLQLTKYNRDINHDKVTLIRSYILNKINNGLSPHIDTLIINTNQDDNNMYIIDGQHRYTALKTILLEDGYDIEVIVCEYMVDSETEKDIFTTLNSGRYTSLEYLNETATELKKFNQALDQANLGDIKGRLYTDDTLIETLKSFTGYNKDFRVEELVQRLTKLNNKLANILNPSSRSSGQDIIDTYNHIIAHNSDRVDEYKQRRKHRQISTVATVHKHVHTRVINHNYLLLTNMIYILTELFQ